MSEYIEVPVLRGFDYSDCIGTMRILKSALPLDPYFHFSIGYVENPFEVACVSPTPDALFKGNK